MKIKPYIFIIRNSIMASLAYRGHFYFSLAGSVIYIVVTWFLWKAIYVNGGTIAGLTFSQAYMYVGISTALSGFMHTASDWHLHNTVVRGDIVQFLTKPIGLSLQFFADEFGFALVNLIMITLPTFIIVFVMTGWGVPSLINIALFIPAVAIGFLLNFFFDFLIGLTVFLTKSIGSISTAKETTVMFLSGAIIPLPFFPEGMRRVLEWLPFQALYNTPIRLLVDNSLNMNEVIFILLRQVGWLLIFYLLVRIFFSLALKKLVVNGG